MASFNRTQIPGPMFNPNFNPRNLNVVSGAEMQPFQRFPNPSFQQPERFMAGNFTNRPPFSNFRSPSFSPNFRSPSFSPNFRNRPPIPENRPRLNIHSAPATRFERSFERPFTPWNQRPSLAPPTQPYQSQPRPPFPPRNNRDRTFQSNRQNKQKARDFRKLKSWMTDELLAEVKKKNMLYLKAKSSDEQTAWQEFRLQRNRVSSLIKEAKIKAGLVSRKFKEEDKTEKPFSCDTCDRAFVTDNELNEHLSQHIKCNQRNCTFEAHPKIVAIHKKMQHETGYAERISKLKDEAEIQKWREERRSRFPTAENVKKRQAEQAERESRGEVLETKEFGKFKRRRTEDGNPRNHGNKRKMRHRYNKDRRNSNFQSHPTFRPVVLNVDSESDSDNDSHITLKQFSGILSLATSACCNLNNEKEVQSNWVKDAHDVDQTSFKNKQDLSKCDSNSQAIIQNLNIADKNPSSVMRSDESTFQSNVKSKENDTPKVDPSESYSKGNKPPKVVISAERMAAVKQTLTKDNAFRQNRAQFTAEGTITPEDSDVELDPVRNRPTLAARLANNASPEGLSTTVAVAFNPAPSNTSFSGNSDDEAPTVIPIIKSKDTAAGASIDLPKNNFRTSNSNTRSSGKRNFNDSSKDPAESSSKQVKLDPDAESFKDYNGNFKEGDITSDSRNVPRNNFQIVNPDVGCSKESPINLVSSESDSSAIPEKQVKNYCTPVKDKSENTAKGNERDRHHGGNERDRHHGDHSRRNGPFNGGQGPAFIARKSTLLEKLLADDIRHERNVILQCMRHIVKKNFFGIGGNKA